MTDNFCMGRWIDVCFPGVMYLIRPITDAVSALWISVMSRNSDIDVHYESWMERLACIFANRITIIVEIIYTSQFSLPVYLVTPIKTLGSQHLYFFYHIASIIYDLTSVWTDFKYQCHIKTGIHELNKCYNIASPDKIPVPDLWFYGSKSTWAIQRHFSENVAFWTIKR